MKSIGYMFYGYRSELEPNVTLRTNKRILALVLAQQIFKRCVKKLIKILPTSDKFLISRCRRARIDFINSPQHPFAQTIHSLPVYDQTKNNKSQWTGQLSFSESLCYRL